MTPVGTDDDGCGVHAEVSGGAGFDAADGGMVGHCSDGIQGDAHDVVVTEMGVWLATVGVKHFISIGTFNTDKGGEV